MLYLSSFNMTPRRSSTRATPRHGLCPRASLPYRSKRSAHREARPLTQREARRSLGDLAVLAAVLRPRFRSFLARLWPSSLAVHHRWIGSQVEVSTAVAGAVALVAGA